MNFNSTMKYFVQFRVTRDYYVRIVLAMNLGDRAFSFSQLNNMRFNHVLLMRMRGKIVV